ncbi:WD domain, G-beta repeat-containing protein [Acanthamoeba castellanii str. Neff]|uniref:WD domain, G-beta repeat-containing protein n=1 Tax=Acanthamoeba castellanii (strain ATCC 30010 / Neff) TaxID=1257118 RepID=L8H2A5_ACACF|nr:WD domain, G-beta repeat-containing protein [Acanthamoeba castellanii str. Neff]ELR19380.1 WD domain, G-beta repeat-containing protein [Acanthamoeba castellanii str. Neff]
MQQEHDPGLWHYEGKVFVFTLGASAEEKETLKTCTWAAGNQFQLAVAGRLGVIRVFGVYEGLHVLQNLVGHTGSVNHLCTKPDDPDIILSASTDGSVRMWNIWYVSCVMRNKS